jgi:hypothetical protein
MERLPVETAIAETARRIEQLLHAALTPGGIRRLSSVRC